jgi:hypothetical protein
MKKYGVMGLTGLLLSTAALAGEFPQAATDCLDLAAYLGDIRRLPDSMYLHRVLLDLTLQNASTTAQISDLANRHALDLFDHPDLSTFGIAAAKTGSGFEQTFKAYQYDCSKVVTGNIFSLEGLSTTWEIVDHSASQVTLRRLTSGGETEISGNLTLVTRRFQAFAPTVFSQTSVYRLETHHACATPVIESNVAIVTEVYVLDGTEAAPELPPTGGLTALQARYPRVATTNGHRGDFAAPLSAQTDPACAAPSAKPTPRPELGGLLGGGILSAQAYFAQ